MNVEERVKWCEIGLAEEQVVCTVKQTNELQ